MPVLMGICRPSCGAFAMLDCADREADPSNSLLATICCTLPLTRIELGAPKRHNVWSTVCTGESLRPILVVSLPSDHVPAPPTGIAQYNYGSMYILPRLVRSAHHSSIRSDVIGL